MSFFLKAYSNYVNFRGRASRSEYWYFTLFYILFIIILSFVDMAIGSYNMDSLGLLSTLFIAVGAIPSLALTIRRIHDTGHCGWWALILVIPVIGGLVILFFALKDSEEGSNEYGPNPKVLV